LGGQLRGQAGVGPLPRAEVPVQGFGWVHGSFRSPEWVDYTQGSAPVIPAPGPEAARHAGPATAQATATARSWNCSSSVEPFRATVELCPPWMVWVTASK